VIVVRDLDLIDRVGVLIRSFLQNTDHLHVSGDPVAQDLVRCRKRSCEATRIVKNDKFRREAVDKVVSFASSQGFGLVGVIESPIAGGDGNIEYLAYFRKADSKE